MELTEEIGSGLEYFQELEHATRMLNHPGESLVLQTDFLYMVERVDICIDYLKTHVCALLFVCSFFPDLNCPCTLAALQGSRDLFTTVPTMHDKSYDSHQNVFRWVATSTHQ